MSGKTTPAKTGLSIRREGFGPITWQLEGEEAQRKQRGVYFTPWAIATHLAELVLKDLPTELLSKPPRVCDPFVGCGVLLATMVEVLTQRILDAGLAGSGWTTHDSGSTQPPGAVCDASWVRKRLLDGCHGVDIDAQMLQLCARSLAGGCGELEASMALRLKHLDALKSPLRKPEAGEVTTAVSWQEAYPEVFNSGGFDLIVANPPWEKVRVNDREFFTQFDPHFSQRSRRERDLLRSELLTSDGIVAHYSEYQSRIRELKAVAQRDYVTAGSGGDLDMYKLAVERCLALVKPAGRVGLIVPQGLLGDWGARKLRRWLLEHHQPLEILRFESGPGLFPEIHANLGILLLVIRRAKREQGQIRVSGRLRELQSIPATPTCQLPTALIRNATPYMMIPLVEGDKDVTFLEHCLRFPSLGQWPESQFKPRREVDMTNHRQHFLPVGEGVPLVEGKHLAPYQLVASNRKWDVAAKTAPYSGQQRIAWRAVADRAMRRRLVAAWVPAGVALGNSLIFTCGQGSGWQESLLWLLAWMNSRVAEAQLQLWCSNNNINVFHIKVCRLPPYDGQNQTCREMVALAAAVSNYRQASCTPNSVLEQLAVRQIGSPDQYRQALLEMENCWREIYQLPCEVWRSSVEARTALVSDWSLTLRA